MKLRYCAFVFATLAGPLATAQPVWADARQDVLSAAQRCAGIADDRTWLDCFYGSAQPMRARLGLPPAPLNQQRLVPGMGVAPAYAAPAYAAPPPAYAAPSYAAPNYAAPAAPYRGPGANVAAAPSGPPPLPRRRDTGVFGSVFGSARLVVSNQRVASVGNGQGGRFVVTLADGEIWQQDIGDNGKPTWRKGASRYVVNVYEGALGSYNMNISDDSTLYKVHRIN
jgi:hypothetical protein